MEHACFPLIKSFNIFLFLSHWLWYVPHLGERIDVLLLLFILESNFVHHCECTFIYLYFQVSIKKCLANSPSNIALTVPFRGKNLYIRPLSKLVVSLGLGSLPSEVNADLAIRAKCRVRLEAWLIKRLLCRLRNLLKHVKRTWRKQKIPRMFLWIVCWK